MTKPWERDYKKTKSSRAKPWERSYVKASKAAIEEPPSTIEKLRAKEPEVEVPESLLMSDVVKLEDIKLPEINKPDSLNKDKLLSIMKEIKDIPKTKPESKKEIKTYFDEKNITERQAVFMNYKAEGGTREGAIEAWKANGFAENHWHDAVLEDIDLVFNHQEETEKSLVLED